VSAPASGPRPIPVLLTVRKLDWGGIERDVTKFAVGFDRSRIVPHVAVYQGGGLRSDEIQRAGVPVLDLRVRSLVSPGILTSMRAFRRYIRQHRIQVVHAFDTSVVLIAPLSRLLRVPLVLSSTLGRRDLYDPKTQRQLPFTDRLVDGIVVNCEAMRRHMIDDYHVPPRRTLLCYNGVETSEFFPAPGAKPASVSDASLVIGTVCVLRPEKRIELLIEAFAAVRKRVPGSKLLIVGSGPELPKLQRQASELAIVEECVFLPAVPEVAPLLRAIDIFVSCSSSEAFSNSILEAMACGCCPVGSRVGGTPELIEDGKRGLLFENGNVLELSTRIALLAENSALRTTLAHNATAFASQELNMQVALNRMTCIYEDGLLRGRSARLE
jgi:L-malate glycosyltransferase